MSYIDFGRTASAMGGLRWCESCPLTPALKALLEATITQGTTNTRVLAEYLFCQEETVKSNFRRISLLLDTHNRAEAVLVALSLGWIELISRRPRDYPRDDFRNRSTSACGTPI